MSRINWPDNLCSLAAQAAHRLHIYSRVLALLELWPHLVIEPAYLAFNIKPEDNSQQKTNKLKPRMIREPMANAINNADLLFFHFIFKYTS
jgi:hypothetical protein